MPDTTARATQEAMGSKRVHGRRPTFREPELDEDIISIDELENHCVSTHDRTGKLTDMLMKEQIRVGGDCPKNVALLRNVNIRFIWGERHRISDRT